MLDLSEMASVLGYPPCDPARFVTDPEFGTILPNASMLLPKFNLTPPMQQYESMYPFYAMPHYESLNAGAAAQVLQKSCINAAECKPMQCRRSSEKAAASAGLLAVVPHHMHTAEPAHDTDACAMVNPLLLLTCLPPAPLIASCTLLSEMLSCMPLLKHTNMHDNKGCVLIAGVAAVRLRSALVRVQHAAAQPAPRGRPQRRRHHFCLRLLPPHVRHLFASPFC